jgi:hypothetical protein
MVRSGELCAVSHHHSEAIDLNLLAYSSKYAVALVPFCHASIRQQKHARRLRYRLQLQNVWRREEEARPEAGKDEVRTNPLRLPAGVNCACIWRPGAWHAVAHNELCQVSVLDTFQDGSQRVSVV